MSKLDVQQFQNAGSKFGTNIQKIKRMANLATSFGSETSTTIMMSAIILRIISFDPAI